MGSQKPTHHIQKTEVVPYAADKIYSLVADVERYPEFLPWCKGSRIKQEGEKEVIAELTVGFGVIETTFTTRNHQRSGKEIRMELVEGPFDRLRGTWQFTPEDRKKTRVTLDLRFQFAQHKLEALFDSAFKAAMEQILEAFTKRADVLYGSSGSG
jgi:ribosome-associated toxin RatA of RatAB toxin-antitoxin module